MNFDIMSLLLSVVQCMQEEGFCSSMLGFCIAASLYCLIAVTGKVVAVLYDYCSGAEDLKWLQDGVWHLHLLRLLGVLHDHLRHLLPA